MYEKKFTLVVAGKEWVASFNNIADQTNGSVMLSCEETVVMATAVMGRDTGNNPGYFNLFTEYMERYYASGEILGGPFTRREGRPSTQAVLGSRIIDRTLRPLFEHHIKNPIQVLITVVAVGDFDPVVLGVNAASLAIATSDIPWAGPVACVRIAQDRKGGELLTNPYLPLTDETETPYGTDVLVCGNEGTLNMIEAGLFEIDEEALGTIFDDAQKQIDEIETWQKSIVKEIGKEKIIIPKFEIPSGVKEMFEADFKPRLMSEIFGEESKKKSQEVESDWKLALEEKYPDDIALEHITREENATIRKQSVNYFHEKLDDTVHEGALQHNKRPDLRDFNQVRDLYAQAGKISNRLHGSGIFYRGGTHVMSFLALGGPDSRLAHEEMEIKHDERFIHHYNFPPYSVGETGRVGGFNRRQIGHGALVQKAFNAVLPTVEDFPYTMRVVSESVASNGSTSQASICATTLALLDGGVPITSPVAGIAIGLMSKGDDYRLLTDIQGFEDHYGDMDFKVAGTRKGVTAIQMDIKVAGVAVSILKEALIEAKAARLHILDTIDAEIKTARENISEYAPKIVVLRILEEKIGAVIGGGGKNIQKLQEDTETKISIEEDGTVFITGIGDGPAKAKARIEAIVKEWKEGEMVTGTIVKLIEIGAIVKISPAHDGLVHVSEIGAFRVNKPEDVLEEGMEIPVKVISVDAARGRIGLSIEKAQPGFIKKPEGYGAPLSSVVKKVVEKKEE